MKNNMNEMKTRLNMANLGQVTGGRLIDPDSGYTPCLPYVPFVPGGKKLALAGSIEVIKPGAPCAPLLPATGLAP